MCERKRERARARERVCVSLSLSLSLCVRERVRVRVRVRVRESPTRGPAERCHLRWCCAPLPSCSTTPSTPPPFSAARPLCPRLCRAPGLCSTQRSHHRHLTSADAPRAFRFAAPPPSPPRPFGARAAATRALCAAAAGECAVLFLTPVQCVAPRRQCAAGVNHVGDCRCRRCSAAATARRRTAAVAPPATARATTRTATLAPTRGAAAAAATTVTTATLAPPAALAAARGGRPRGARSRGRRRATPRPTSRCRSMGSAGR